MTDRPFVTFVGTLPPPMTGMTISSSNVIAYLAQRVELRRFNLSSERFHLGWKWKLMRAINYARAAIWLARRPRRQRESLYLVANAGFGLWYDLLIVAVARTRGYRVLLQHRVYSYLWRRDWRMAALHQLMGRRGAHVCLCRDMIDRFKGQYDGACEVFRLPNSMLADEVGWEGVAADRSESPTLRLGHLSNLTIDKGLKQVLDTFAQLRREEVDVRLVLAGRCDSPREQELIDEARREFDDRVEHIGPVYGDEKWRFFREIDVMLFPTQYRNEAQPRVVLESMVCGAPVLTFDRACIAGMLGEHGEGGLCVPMEDDFVKHATAAVKRLANNRGGLKGAQDRAAAHGRSFHEQARRRLDDFVEWIAQTS